MDSKPPLRPSARTKLLDAAIKTVREKGYSATTIDDLCAQAGVTKGAFFHHFRSKDELAVAAAEHWSLVTGTFFAQAGYHAHVDPLDRLLGYIAFRKMILQGPVSQFTCLVGTMVQETYDSHHAIRDACARSINDHAAHVERDIEIAMQQRGIAGGWTARSLALHTQAVLQGAFILAKATDSRDLAADCVDHLYRYVALLFGREKMGEEIHVQS